MASRQVLAKTGKPPTKAQVQKWYDDFKAGKVTKTGLEKEHFDKSTANGKIMTTVFRTYLGIESEAKHPRMAEVEGLRKFIDKHGLTDQLPPNLKVKVKAPPAKRPAKKAAPKKSATKAGPAPVSSAPAVPTKVKKAPPKIVDGVRKAPAKKAAPAKRPVVKKAPPAKPAA